MFQPLQATHLPSQLKNYGLQYSPAVCYIASSLQRVHQIWQSYIRGQQYRNPNNWLGLALGQLTNFHFGTNLLVQLTAAPFFITARILDLFEQEDRVLEAFATWKIALKGRYVFKYECPLVRPSKINYIISRYRITKWKQSFSTLLQRIRIIFWSSIALLSEIFALIMRFMDVLELFTLDKERMKKHLDRAILEGGITIPRVLNTLCNNRGLFLLRLEKMEEIFLKVVQRDPDRAKQSSQLISNTRAFFEQLETGLDFYKTTSEVAGDVVVKLFKKVVYLLTPSVFENFMRENFYDPSQPNWFRPAEPLEHLEKPPAEIFTLKIIEIKTKRLNNPKHKFIQLTPHLHYPTVNPHCKSLNTFDEANETSMPQFQLSTEVSDKNSPFKVAELIIEV